MWFKNITLLTLPADFDIGLTELERALAARPLRSPGPLEDEYTPITSTSQSATPVAR